MGLEHINQRENQLEGKELRATRQMDTWREQSTAQRAGRSKGGGWQRSRAYKSPCSLCSQTSPGKQSPALDGQVGVNLAFPRPMPFQLGSVMMAL